MKKVEEVILPNLYVRGERKRLGGDLPPGGEVNRSTWENGKGVPSEVSRGRPGEGGESRKRETRVDLGPCG